MSADCLRSTHVWNPARFKAAKKTMPASAILMSRISSIGVEHLIRAAPRERMAQLCGNIEQNTPVFARVLVRRKGAAKVLLVAVAVHESAVLFQVRGGR